MFLNQKNKSAKALISVLFVMFVVACAPGAGQPSDDSVEPAVEPVVPTVDSGNGDEVEAPVAPSVEPETLPMFVGAETVDCVGVAPQTCMLVKFDPNDEWTYFYDVIVGFTYEPGFEYELRVVKNEIEDPPADGSSIEYVLAEVVSKTAVSATPNTDADNLLDLLMSNKWDLVEYGSIGGSLATLPGTVATLEFTAGELNGSTGCNSFFGSFTLDGTSIEVGPVGMTEMWCEGGMEQETAVINHLNSAHTISIENDVLMIQSAEGNLIYQPASNATLEGVVWTLNSIVQGDAVVSTAIDHEITAEFNNGELAGFSGCNQYFTNYETDDNNLTIGLIAGTLMACEGDQGQREMEFMSALANVAGFEISRNSLTLTDADGQSVIYFQAGMK
ncbi:MAG: META domain-containing protein [Chloroflexi bacterium]|nr:META domain-containing protein [Chloroflexota bacterium]